MPDSATTAQADSPSAVTPVAVIDSAARSGPQRTVQLLGDADIFVDDDARTALLIAKRVNHALHADFSKEGLSQELLGKVQAMQAKYRPIVKETPHDQLVESGQLNALLTEYVGILLDRSKEKLERLKGGELKGDESNPASLLQAIAKEEKRINGLEGELKTYNSGSDYTKQLLKRIEPLAKLDNYTPIGKLAIKSGMVKNATEEVAADLVNDVLGTAAARHVMAMARRLDDVKPVDATRAEVVALAEREMTQPLSSLFEFEPENKQLDRITALRTLASAQLHHAFSEDNLTEPQKIAMVKAAKDLIREHAQVAASLAWHYLNEGAAANDPRVEAMRGNFRKEVEKSGIVLIENEVEAVDKARKLARASAEDLMVAANGDAKLTGMITSLAKAAGDPVEVMPLAAKSQLIGTRVDDPSDFKTILTGRYRDLLTKAAEVVKPGISPAGIIK